MADDGGRGNRGSDAYVAAIGEIVKYLIQAYELKLSLLVHLLCRVVTGPTTQ
jgi:hypothetical protein